MMPYGDIHLVNIGSSNSFLPDGIKPLSEPMLLKISILDISSKIINSKLQLPGANELSLFNVSFAAHYRCGANCVLFTCIGPRPKMWE